MLQNCAFETLFPHVSIIDPSSYHCSFLVNLFKGCFFTSKGVQVRTVTRSIERYDLDSENQTNSAGSVILILLTTPLLLICENWIVRVTSRSRKINQSECLRSSIVIGLLSRFCFILNNQVFYRIISYRVVSGIRSRLKYSSFLTPILSSL